MKGKTFFILLVAAGVLAALAFFRFGDQNQTQDTTMGQKVFSDLPLNQVASITIADATQRVTLVKGEETWQVQERGGYPADFGELRDVVVKLSRLKIGRSFTGSPESLSRLSLLNPSAEESTGQGTQITLKDAADKILADVILGQVRQTDDGGSGGQYLKKTDGDTVYLVDGAFRFLKTDPADWLQDEILNIKADSVASVTCYAEGNTDPVFTLARPEKGKAPQLSPVPSGRRVDSAKIDQVFDAMSPLTLDDVESADKHPKKDDAGARRLVYQLYDGRRILLFPESDDNEHYWVRVTAEETANETAIADTSDAAGAADEPAKAEQKDPADAKVPEKQGGQDTPAVKTAQAINAELGAWVFSIKKWQFDSLITQADALLESAPDDAKQSS
jgi:hypothetical protein